jgi:hypothetical protein
MASLTVSEYDSKEQDALAELPNRIIEAFQPVLWNKEIGYPTRVNRESALFKYIDVLHELRFESDYLNLLGGITQHEFDLLKKLTSLVLNFSESQFHRKAITRSSLIRMINVLRHIKYLFGDERPRVFEIGPGSGYLGAMLLLEGYPYAATDVTQAFYLYQNHLWNFISKGNVFEGAKEKITPDLLGAIPPGSAVHIPWWEFVQLKPESVPEFDIVTCNHALCEMHLDSLRFTLRMARSFLESQNSLKAFVFEGWGYKQNTKISVGSVALATDMFYRFGFSLVHNDSRLTIFAPSGTKNAIGSCPWEDLSNSYVPNYFAAVDNPLCQAVLKGRQETQSLEKVDIKEVNAFYTELLGSEDHLSPDEHFCKLVSRRY